MSPLCLLSFFYQGVVALRLKFYEWGIFSVRSLPCKVISVGNLTLGGTGKTPFVALLAEWLKARGIPPAILSRGYGGTFRGPFDVVTDGEKLLMDAQQAGDEPFLLAKQMKGIPVIVGKNRFQSGRWAIERFPSEVLILDDGYQHLSLHRDVNLLLLNDSSPFGNGYLLPRGILREPISQIKRADAIVLTKSGLSDNINKIKELLEERKLKIPIFRAAYEPCGVKRLGEGNIWPPKFLEGKKVLAFAGLADPQSFKDLIRQMGVQVLSMEVFADHHRYTPNDWSRLHGKAKAIQAEGLVTTEKDEVKIESLGCGSLPLWIVSIRHIFLGEDQRRFEMFLLSRLGRGHE